MVNGSGHTGGHKRAIPLWVTVLIHGGALLLAGYLGLQHKKKHVAAKIVQQTSDRLIARNREAYESLAR